MEGASSGATEAGSIRLATHLGRGSINSAKLCTWKCLFLSTSLGIFETSILFICGNDISTWFTDDKFLQDIMNNMLPVVGIGNILMVFGMVRLHKVSLTLFYVPHFNLFNSRSLSSLGLLVLSGRPRKV